MNSQVVVYTNTNGYKEFRRVPENYHPSKYNQGIFLGPPSLRTIDLTGEEELQLNNALVDAGFISYSDFDNRRSQLVDILKHVLIPTGQGDSERISLVRNMILALYQQESLSQEEN